MRAKQLVTLISVLAVCFGITQITLGQAAASYAGSYPTKVSLVSGSNSCGDVTVQDNVTKVEHTTGSDSISLTHVGNKYSGKIAPTGEFQTRPKTLDFNGIEYTITIEGRFSGNSFEATTHVKQKQLSPQKTCSYDVKWLGKKTGG